MAETELIFKEFKKDGPLKINDIKIVAKIWKDFNDIYLSVRDNTYPKENRIEMIKNNCFDWLKMFEKKYDPSKITVYMHIFGEHLWEMVQLHGDINLFTMQGLEKLNDLTTMWYYGSTNRKGGDRNYLVQLMNKRNRVDLIHSIEKIPGDLDTNFHLVESFLLRELEKERALV